MAIQKKIKKVLKAIRKKEKTTIGWREFISLPDLGVDSIKVKVDTGARTSSIHVSEVKIITRGENEYAHFVVHPKQKSAKPEVKAKAKVIEHRKVTSSTGHASVRPVIKTKMVIGGKKREIELTLVNRDMMGFRMLLGREAVRGEYIIDPGMSFLVSEKKPKRSTK